MRTNQTPSRVLTIGDLLRPHWKALAFAFIAVLGESGTDLLQPWPLKIVLDSVLGAKHPHSHGWLDPLIHSITGGDRLATLKLAAIAALAIAVVGALCSFCEKYLTTTVGQWVMHDLRRRLYSHIQRLSLAYHDHKQTGDLISRVTSDIAAIQTFIASGLLGAAVDCVTLVGMVTVMFVTNWRFTLIALSVAPPLFAVVYSYTRRIKKAAREVRKKEGEIVSVIQEVLTSIRVVKAFAREEFEQQRLEEESLESVEIALHARGLKAKLSPLVEIIVAVGTSMVLWFGARMVLDGTLSSGDLIVFIWYLGKMYKPMQDLSKMTDSYSKAAVGYERIREVLQTNHVVLDLPGARPAPRFHGQIEFENVVFGYEPNGRCCTTSVFALKPGRRRRWWGRPGRGRPALSA